jgi:hypothetical protein
MVELWPEIETSSSPGETSWVGARAGARADVSELRAWLVG